ncbi:MAG: hypothetical protein WCF17_05775, partial [Terracidiphilus sp.]
MSTPHLDWAGDEPRVTPPAMPVETLSHINHWNSNLDAIERHGYWGTVTSWNRSNRTVKTAHVGAVLMT